MRITSLFFERSRKVRVFLIIFLVVLGVLATNLPVQAAECSEKNSSCTQDTDCCCSEAGVCVSSQCQRSAEGGSCNKDQDCCNGAGICAGGICKAGLFTRGQTRACIDEGNCSKCDLLNIVKNIFQFLVQIAGALAVLGIVIAGIMYMTGGGALGRLTTEASAAGVEKAKNALTAVIVGFVIVLFAWTMITWIMHFLGYEQAVGHTWWSIQCGP